MIRDCDALGGRRFLLRVEILERDPEIVGPGRGREVPFLEDHRVRRPRALEAGNGDPTHPGVAKASAAAARLNDHRELGPRPVTARELDPLELGVGQGDRNRNLRPALRVHGDPHVRGEVGGAVGPQRRDVHRSAARSCRADRRDGQDEQRG